MLPFPLCNLASLFGLVEPTVDVVPCQPVNNDVAKLAGTGHLQVEEFSEMGESKGAPPPPPPLPLVRPLGKGLCTLQPFPHCLSSLSGDS